MPQFTQLYIKWVTVIALIIQSGYLPCEVMHIGRGPGTWQELSSHDDGDKEKEDYSDEWVLSYFSSHP